MGILFFQRLGRGGVIDVYGDSLISVQDDGTPAVESSHYKRRVRAIHLFLCELQMSVLYFDVEVDVGL